MSWRSSAERELRARVSPELLAGALVIVLIVALFGILGLAQSDGTEPAPGGSTAEPTASANRDPTTTVDTTSMHLGHARKAARGSFNGFLVRGA